MLGEKKRVKTAFEHSLHDSLFRKSEEKQIKTSPNLLELVNDGSGNVNIQTLTLSYIPLTSKWNLKWKIVLALRMMKYLDINLSKYISGTYK